MKRRREIYLAFGLIFLGIILLFATSGIINTSFSVIKEQTGKYDKVKDKINSKSLLSKDKNKHKKANYALHKVLVKIKTSLWSNIFREDYKKVEKMSLLSQRFISKLL